MNIIPLTLKAANEYVCINHRHHGKVQGCKFCIGVSDSDGHLHGVAIVGRPVSRCLDDGATAEVTRLCTDGYRNACSYLYAACARIAKEMGYMCIITYILDKESGVTLRAAGWHYDGICGGGNWNSKSRPRTDSINPCRKQKYCKKLR